MRASRHTTYAQFHNIRDGWHNGAIGTFFTVGATHEF